MLLCFEIHNHVSALLILQLFAKPYVFAAAVRM